MLLTELFVTNNLYVAVIVLTQCHAKLTKNTIFQVKIFLSYCTYTCVSPEGQMHTYAYR